MPSDSDAPCVGVNANVVQAEHGLSDGRILWSALAFAAVYVACAVPVLAWTGLPLEVLGASVMLGATLALLSAIDLHTYRLPDVLTLPLAAAGLLFCAVLHWDEVRWRFLSAALAYLALYSIAVSYQRIRGRQGLGLGDAKLLAASGAWLGLEGLPTVVLLASGAACCGVLLNAGLGKRLTSSSAIAFGPFLASATWLVWLYGPLN